MRQALPQTWEDLLAELRPLNGEILGGTFTETQQERARSAFTIYQARKTAFTVVIEPSAVGAGWYIHVLVPPRTKESLAKFGRYPQLGVTTVLQYPSGLRWQRRSPSEEWTDVPPPIPDDPWEWRP